MEKKLLHGIDTIIIRVSDIENSKKWYQNILGLKLVWEDQNLKLAVFDSGGLTSLTIWDTNKNSPKNNENSTYPIFKTIDINVAHQELKKKGVDVGNVIVDGEVLYFFFYDIDGNYFEVCQYN